jgi:PHP family Zn ribbon phosphoesterase
LKCRGILKKGVSDRIKEIAKLQENLELKQIATRPEYKYLIPLAQIIQFKIGKGELYNKRVLEKYTKLITKYKEIEIMLELPEDKLKELDEDIAKLVMAFRNGLVVFRPGGGGHYGVPFICFSQDEKQKKLEEILKEQEIPFVQKTLF